MSNDTPPQASAQNYWKKCSSCKKEIGFGAQYYLCSVSTCRHSRTGLRFCSVGCWDAHLGYANHRSSFAEEAKAPRKEEYLRILEEEGQGQNAAPRDPVKKIIAPAALQPPPSALPVSASVNLKDIDTLIVVSKVKQLIRERSGFNTSQCCIDALTRKVVDESLKGIKKAEEAGRKTVMGRDII